MKGFVDSTFGIRLAAFKGWWSLRPPREQVILATAAALLILGLAYWFLWQPAAVAIARLQAELPALRAQDAEMQAMALEAKRLRAGSGQTAELPSGERRAAVLRSLERAGLGARSAKTSQADGGTPGNNSTISPTAETSDVASEGESRVRVRLAHVDYAAWAGWLANAEAELGARSVRVTVAALKPDAGAGRIQADVLLEFARVNNHASANVDTSAGTR